MKMTFGKNLTAEKIAARSILKALFQPRLMEAMGPDFAWYQAKYMAARDGGVFVDPSEAAEVIKRFEMTLANMKAVDVELQAAQAEIDACTTVPAMKAVITRFDPLVAAALVGTDAVTA